MAQIITIPEGIVPYYINLDLNGDTVDERVWSQQYDTETRYIVATIWNNGILYPLTTSHTINFVCTKPSTGFGVNNEAGIDAQGRAVYKITDQTTAENGRFKAEFRIYDSLTGKVSTPNFNMYVEKSALSNETIISTPEVNVLTALILEANNVIVRDEERQIFYDSYKVLEVYNSNKQYVFGNKVTYQGNTFQCISPTSLNILPTNQTNWILIAKKGEQGIQGTQGVKGDPGIQGVQGVQGAKGDKGDKGDIGIQGIQGIQGLKGDKGDKGQDGAGGDMFKTSYDPTNKAQDIFAYIDNGLKTKYDVDSEIEFTEATVDADIVTNDNTPTLWGKVLKRFNTIKEINTQLKQKTLNNLFVNTNKIEYIAHRGASAFAPENTIPAFEVAGSLGYWGVECDIHETLDNELVIIHDNTVDAMTNGTGNVSSFTLGGIKALNIDSGSNIALYSGTKVPTLEAYLIVCKKWGMVPIIEVKSELTSIGYNKLINLLKQYGLLERCIVISFLRSAIEEVRARSLVVTVAPLLEISQENIDYIKSLGNALINCSLVTKDNVLLCHEQGIKVMVWNIDTATNLQSCRDAGADFITTNQLIGGTKC